MIQESILDYADRKKILACWIDCWCNFGLCYV